MIVLGIDPGLQITGYGVLDFEKEAKGPIRLLEAGIIEPRKQASLPNRLNTIYSNLDEIIRQHHPDVMVLEKLYSHTKHPYTASILGHVRGVICLLCAQRSVKLIEQSVKRIRKSVVGNGNATKQQTQKVVAHVLKIDEQKLTLDASDALALSLGYIYCHRNIA